MKARLLKIDKEVLILCNDGTIINADQSLIARFFSNFDNVNIFNGSDGNWKQFHLDMGEYPGVTLAYVTDSDQLVVVSPWAMKQALSVSAGNHKLISVADYAKKYNRSREMVKAFAQQDRIPGAFKVGRAWLIPEDAPYPVEEGRRKPTSGNFNL